MGRKMIKIDSDLLDELGLAELSIDEKNDAIETIKHTLDERVGDRAIDSLTDNQTEELEKQMVGGTAEGTAEWLQKNVSDYQNIVNEEFEKIKNQIKSQGLASITGGAS